MKKDRFYCDICKKRIDHGWSIQHDEDECRVWEGLEIQATIK